MLKFVLLLTVWSPDAPPRVYVQDYNLTGEDCIERLLEVHALDPGEAYGTPSCEIDHAEVADLHK